MGKPKPQIQVEPAKVLPMAKGEESPAEQLVRIAGKPLDGVGIVRVPGGFVAYQMRSDGRVEVLTPLYAGQVRGEAKDHAAGRMRVAMQRAFR